MPELEQLLAECRQLLATGEAVQALENLTAMLASTNRELHNEVLLHQSRWRSITDQERKGLLAAADAEVQRSRLTMAVLDLLDVIPDKLQLVATPPPQNATVAGPRETTQTNAPAPDQPFDVFLSHNSEDKPAVKAVGLALKERGLRVWLDAWELPPGQPWQAEVERVLSSIRSAAVFVGPNGLGPWEAPEMRVCLDQFVQRQLPVIPVLLPGVVGRPDLPLFLAQFTWVDLSAGVSNEGLDQIQWAVTGEKP